MQTLLLTEQFVTVKAAKDAGVYIWENEAVYTYQWYGFGERATRSLRLHGFFKGIDSNGIVDCGNGVYCVHQDDCYLENLSHVE